MIHLNIASARKKPDACNVGKWWVMHPSNDSILASCDTEEEADRVIASLFGVGAILEGPREPIETTDLVRAAGVDLKSRGLFRCGVMIDDSTEVVLEIRFIAESGARS